MVTILCDILESVSHGSCTRCYGKTCYTSFESCAGMIALLAEENGLALTKRSATAIFTGMVTDSGRFRFDSVSARTFALASFLMSAGIDTTSLYRELYSEDLERAKFRASFLQKIKRYKESCVAYIYNTAEELREMGITDPFQISRGMVNVMADLRGIDVWVNFTEDGDKVLCELRSSCYKACGADVRDHAMAMEMLEDLRILTETQHEE